MSAPRRLILSIALTAIAAACQAPPDVSLIIENGRVIVGDGSVLERGSVAILGDRIVHVGEVPPGTRAEQEIDASGRTVLPGLIDTHVHPLMEALFEQPRGDDVMQDFIENRLPARLRAFLAAGITTVMSPGDYWPFAERVAEGIRTGEIAGPRYYTAGRLLTAPEGHPAVTFCGSLDVKGPNPWCREHLTIEVDEKEEARRAVESLAAQGADLIKLVYDGTDVAGVLETELVAEIVAAAHARQLRAYGHILEVPRAIEALEAGIDGLVHPPAIFSEPGEVDRLVALMRERRVATSTTLTTFESIVDILRDQGDEETAAVMRALLEEIQRTIARLAATADGLVVLGTDSPHLAPGEAYHREIRLVTEAGLSPDDVIRAATRDGAVYMGLDDDLGTLEAGKLADILIVEGDPLADPAALERVVTVVQGGRILPAVDPSG